MKPTWLVRSLLFASVFLAGGLQASAQTRIVNVSAWIDGRSHLILGGATAQWQHFDWAAPGRLDCDTGTPTQPTYIDLVTWWPEWPDIPTCENRWCGGCTSNVYTGVAPPLPSSPYTAQIGLSRARGVLEVIELPNAANGYHTVILFDDTFFNAADWYSFELYIDADCWVESYCTSTINSSGSSAVIGVEGGTSVSAGTTTLTASGCPPQRPGIFFYGGVTANMPLANGRLCIDPFSGIYRIGADWTDSQGRASLPLDPLLLPPSAPILAGSTWHFQYWFRDPAGGGTGSNLTDAVSVHFCP